jgi:Ran GTPase-activating protein (RanGAP) involved in mRNA processing and transport
MRPASSVTPAKGNATSKFSKLEKYRKSYRYSDGEWAASYDGDTAPFIYSSLRENEESFDLPGARWNNGKDAAQGDGNFEPVWQKLKDGWKSQEEASKSVEVISTDRREFDRRLNLGEQCLRIHSSRRSGYTDPSKVPVTMYGRGMSNKTEKLYDSLLIPKKEKARRALLRFSSLSTKQKQRLLNMMPMDPPPEAANKVKLFKRDTASAMAYYKMKKEKRAEAVQEQLWMSKSQRRASISFMHLGANGSRMPRRKRLTPLEIEAEEQAAEINAIASAHQEKRLEFYDEFRQVSEGKLRGNRGNGDTASYDDFDTDDSKYTSFIEDLDDKRLPPEPLPLRLLNNSVKHSSAFSETDDSETETEDNEGTRGRKVGLGIGLAHFGIGNERGAALSKAMQELTDLKEVNLSDNRLGDDTVCKLLLAMRQNHHLRKLDLSSNVVGASSFGVLMPLLWDTSSNLTDLSLHDCKVGQSQIQQMVRALSGAEGQSRQMQLTKLDLSRNRIGAAGAEQLAILLQKRTCNISDLNLSWNSIQKHGVAALGEALQRKFCPLKKLDLAFNQLGHDTMHIAEALRENTSLEELDISQNHFKGESTLVLAQMLSMNTTLQKLKLSGNLIGEDGGRAIMRAVMGDVCNCEVNMQGCSYPCDEDAFDPQVVNCRLQLSSASSLTSSYTPPAVWSLVSLLPPPIPIHIHSLAFTRSRLPSLSLSLSLALSLSVCLSLSATGSVQELAVLDAFLQSVRQGRVR